MKILTILGTRPEIIRLSSIIKRLEKNFNHILVNTGQNWSKLNARTLMVCYRGAGHE